MELLRTGATKVRITLMYYVDFYSLFNKPEKEWDIILSKAFDAPSEPSTVLCASATAASFSLIDRNNSSGVSPFSFSAFAAFNLFSAPRKNTNAKGST